ncbi:hypothetical protein DPMN_101247 [Dreissena polymorpha]|uniref:Uncharacterized protein n=1 Tax=Dreissena polymorpha TaxID=45954 RepID=A0A9D4LIS2_DREPO|nr:hypothetical protein DPMN_101247 [Dreissena polymorpha]
MEWSNKISSMIAQIRDKRVTQEINKIRNDVDTKTDNLKRGIQAEVRADVDVLNDRINEVVNAQSLPRNNSDHDISLNVFIRELPESASENIMNKVNDGLKVSGVECARAERKESRDSGKPGLVVVGFRSHNDKRKVMEKKSDLRDSQQYEGVFINHDKSLQERQMADNFRTI